MLKTLVKVLIIIILISLATAGCKDRSSGEPEQPAVAPAPQKKPVIRASAPEPPKEQEIPAVLEYDDVVLARVNGDPVTQYDLNLTVRSVLGDQAADMDRQALRKALGSLVASRAIAQAREAGMSDRDLAALEKKVRAYREELLVRQYLKEHTAARPVTREMIQEYYNSHPEQFGARRVRMYEMIAASRKTDPREQKALAALLGNVRLKEDWKEWAETLRDRGFPLTYRTGQTDKKMMHPRLYTVLQSAGEGETSPVIFINSMCHVARITHIAETGPHPTEEVIAEIRKSLEPVQLGKAVREASARVLGQAEITYENNPKKPQ